LPAERRGECRNLVLTALRNLGTINALLARRLSRPLADCPPPLLHLLQLGAAELLWLETPAYAAVHSYVELAKSGAGAKQGGLVNAVLKRLSEQGKEELAQRDIPRSNTPDWLWKRWCAAFGEDAARRMAEQHGHEAPLDLTLKRGEDAARWAELLEAELLPSGSLRRRNAGIITALPGFREGAWWVQDASAALPVQLMGAMDGLRALDLCAAPGGKTAQMAAAGAQVTALDRAPARLERVRENLTRLGLAAELIAADALNFRTPHPFPRVLLDAPCTATGTLRRHPEAAWQRKIQDVTRLAAAQKKLLAHAAALVAEGGTLVYSVCSLEPEEGERQVEEFLLGHPQFRLLAANAAAPHLPPEWVDAHGALRILPHYLGERGGMDGFYAAALMRSG
jgi:16S rRNA (cytosine967-C5)-methyltransferase